MTDLTMCSEAREETDNRIIDWVRMKRTTSGSSALTSLLRVILDCMAQDCFQAVLEYPQRGRFQNLSGQFEPVLDHQHDKEIPLHIEVELSVYQFLPIAFFSIACHKQADPFGTFLRHSYSLIRSSLSHLFSRLSRLISLSPSSLREMLQSLNHLCCPTLDPLQGLHAALVLRSPERDKALQIRGQRG